MAIFSAIKHWFGKEKKFLYATSILIGTFVGVGVFGIPFAFSKSGPLVGFIFLAVTGVAILIVNLMMAEVALRTNERHQLTGYAGIYIGEIAKHVAFFAGSVGIYAALLSYTIIAGRFLLTVSSNFATYTIDTFSYIFFSVAALLVLLRLKTAEWIEFSLTVILTAVVFIIFGFGVSSVRVENFDIGSWGYWFLPYGILLFAFSGMSSIPIQREVLRGQERRIGKSVLAAVVFVALLYALFAITVVGISGDNTTDDAISGLYSAVGPNIVWLGSLFGILTVMTSFLMIGNALRNIFHFDFGINRTLAWAMTVIPPILLFMGGLRKFVDVMVLAGAIGVGLEGFILIFVFRKARQLGKRNPEFTAWAPTPVLWLIAVMFFTGIVYALFEGA